MPEVSVVIPVYNGASTIIRAVTSVLTQSFQDFELIVVDDGSVDATRALLTPYFDRLTYIYQENQERSAARNRGIQASKGEYVAFLDADDWWHPLKLQQQVAVLQAHPGVALVYVQRVMVTTTTPQNLILPGDLSYQVHTDFFPELALRDWVGSPSQVLVTRSALEKIGFFDPALRQGEDWDLWLRIAAQYPVAAIKEPLVYYQVPLEGELKRLAKRNMCAAYQQIVSKLFACPDIRQRYAAVETRMLARIFLQCALLDCALGDLETGRAQLVKAWDYDPALFVPPAPELAMWLVEYATALDRIPVPLSKSQAFIDAFWSMLPLAVVSQLSLMRNQIKGQIAAQRFFEVLKRQDYASVRDAAWQTVRFQSHWLKNRGFIISWAKAIWHTMGHRSQRIYNNEGEIS